MKTLMLAAAFALTLSATAQAEQLAAAPVSHEDAHAVAVSHASLDLARSEDAAILLSRLRNAAARACDVPQVSRPDARLRRAMAQCEADAVAQAVAQLDSPALTRLAAIR